MVSARWFRDIGPAPSAERRSPNCLLNRMATDRFTAVIATNSEGKVAPAPAVAIDEDFNKSFAKENQPLIGG